MQKKTIFSVESAVKIVLHNIIDISLATTDIGKINFKICHPSQETMEYRGFDIPEDYNERNHIMISISDTGVGFLDNDAELIFEPSLRKYERVGEHEITSYIVILGNSQKQVLCSEFMFGNDK